MAAEQSTKPICCSPEGLTTKPSHRGTGRQSITSSSYIPLPPQIESPRTLCPRDGDAFSYNPGHLSAWYTPQELWPRLPDQLQSALTAMQHAGAAVLTGYERLEQQSDSVDLGIGAPALEDELEVQPMDSFSSPLPRLRTLSRSRCDSLVTTPSLSPSISSMGSTPSVTASQTTSPVSPICLTPADMTPASEPKQRKERSFSIPLEPHNAYYATELSHLRTEAIPRLRHAARKVDTEWYECKRLDLVTGSVHEFEEWWAEKKDIIHSLDEKGKRLSVAFGLSPTGMGWTV